jgi:DNA-binding transcriptional ArsR family regulator
MATQQPGRVPGDHVWTHVFESGSIAGLLTWLTGYAHLPITEMIVIAVVAAGGAAALTAAHFEDAGGLAGYMSAWSLLGGWLIYDRLAGHQSLMSAAVLAGLVLLLMAAGGAVFSHHYASQAAENLADSRRVADAALQKWEERFGRLGAAGVRAYAEEKTRAGREIHLRLPDTGKVKLSTLESLTGALAVVLRVDDSQVSFHKGAHAGHVILRISEQDVLAEIITYPGEAEVLTVNSPFTVGLHERGEQAQILLREIQTLVNGVTGSGKSNLLNVLIAKLSSCVDVILCVIDVSGSALCAPWIQPWIESQLAGDGSVAQPVITWVASTRQEAWTMLCALERVMDSRRAGLTMKSKVTPSHEEPQYVILGDEATDILGDDTVVAKEKQTVVSNFQFVVRCQGLTRKARAAALAFLWATQRGTVGMTGGGDLKSQCKQRISLGAVAESDARQAIPDSLYAQRLLARLQHKGSGIIWLPGNNRPDAVKFYRLDTDSPEDRDKIRQIAIRNSALRPSPTKQDLEAMGSAWKRRWEDCELYHQLAQEYPDHPAAPSGPRPGTSAALQLAGQDLKTEFEKLMETGGAADLGQIGQDRNIPAGRLRMLALLAERPLIGMQVAEICLALEKEALGVDRTTVHRWLKAEEAAGRVSNRHGRWFIRTDTDQQPPA